MWYLFCFFYREQKVPHTLQWTPFLTSLLCEWKGIECMKHEVIYVNNWTCKIEVITPTVQEVGTEVRFIEQLVNCVEYGTVRTSPKQTCWLPCWIADFAKNLLRSRNHYYLIIIRTDKPPKINKREPVSFHSSYLPLRELTPSSIISRNSNCLNVHLLFRYF